MTDRNTGPEGVVNAELGVTNTFSQDSDRAFTPEAGFQESAAGDMGVSRSLHAADRQLDTQGEMFAAGDVGEDTAKEGLKDIGKGILAFTLGIIPLVVIEALLAGGVVVTLPGWLGGIGAAALILVVYGMWRAIAGVLEILEAGIQKISDMIDS